MEAVREMEIISRPSRAARISVSVSEEQCLVKCGTQWNSFYHCRKAGQGAITAKGKNAINHAFDKW